MAIRYPRREDPAAPALVEMMASKTVTILPCPFCGSPAREQHNWPAHYGCNDVNCGAYHAALSLKEWNTRPAHETSASRDARRYAVISRCVAPKDLYDRLVFDGKPLGKWVDLSREQSIRQKIDELCDAALQRSPEEPTPKRGCQFDTDGDGNCPFHPNGCPPEKASDEYADTLRRAEHGE